MTAAGAIAHDRTPPFSSVETVRLWFSFQRYAFLLLGVVATMLTVVILFAPTAWWAWVLAGLVSLKVASFGVEVWRRWPEKIRVAAVGVRRIRAGRFKPKQVRSICGDPCFRVVAREVLARSGMPRAERNALVRRYKAEIDEENSQVIIFDHINGRVLTVEGGQTVPVPEPITPPQTNGVIP